jgi:SAM-dependent methyltransferase
VTVGAVYANLLLNMALSRTELRALVNEIRRVLRPGGLLIYTAWSTEDPGHGRGTDLGDGLSIQEGFAVRFFDRGLIDELADRWELGGVVAYSEGPERHRLWRVIQARPG